MLDFAKYEKIGEFATADLKSFGYMDFSFYFGGKNYVLRAVLNIPAGRVCISIFDNANNPLQIMTPLVDGVNLALSAELVGCEIVCVSNSFYFKTSE